MLILPFSPSFSVMNWVCEVCMPVVISTGCYHMLCVRECMRACVHMYACVCMCVSVCVGVWCMCGSMINSKKKIIIRINLL